MSMYSNLLVQLGSTYVGPPLDVAVPRVGGFLEVASHAKLSYHIRDVGGRQQRGNFRRQGEWRVAGIHLPSILLGHRAVPYQVARCSLDHRPQQAQFIVVQAT